jgi:hypothetical protein
MNTTNNRGELSCTGMVFSSCSTSGTHRVTITRHEHRVVCESCWIHVYVEYTNYINKT